MFQEFLTPAFAAAIAATAFGGLIRGFTGFGTGLVMMPLLAVIYTPVEAVAILLLLSSITGYALVLDGMRWYRWRTVVPIIAAVTIATPFGAYVLITSDPEFVRKAIGVLIFASALLMLRGWVYRGPRGAFISGLFGLFGGTLTGFGGIGGPSHTFI